MYFIVIQYFTSLLAAKK